MGVTCSPCPAMMPERMGIMGNTHGVKASSRPKPKNEASTSHSEPCATSLARRSCSETIPEPVSVPVGAVLAAAEEASATLPTELPTAAALVGVDGAAPTAGSATVRCRVSGG